MVPIIATIFLMPKLRFRKNQAFLLVFPVCITLMALFHFFSIYNGNYLFPLIGLYVVMFPYIFWLIVSQAVTNLDIRKIDLFFIYVGVVNVVGAIIFFFMTLLCLGLSVKASIQMRLRWQ